MTKTKEYYPSPQEIIKTGTVETTPIIPPSPSATASEVTSVLVPGIRDLAMDNTKSMGKGVGGVGVVAGSNSTTTSSSSTTTTGKTTSSATPPTTNNSSGSGSASTNNSSSGGGGGVVMMATSASAGSQNVEQIVPKQQLLNILPAVTDCIYTPCYCEENVWKLCDRVKSDFSTELEHCHVAFISNKKRMVPMWRQRAGKNEEKLALWDYHVILLYNPDDRCVVYDMDSELPFPTHFHRYVSETFRTENILQAEYHRFFRVSPASRFLSLFSSDRSHMMKPDRSWMKPPPNYPPICVNNVNNLEQFIDMTDPKNEFGEMFTLMELVRKFFKKPS